METDVLVLDHDAAGLEAILDIEVLREVVRGRVEPLAQVSFLTILREGDAVHWTNVDASVAFDAELRREYGLDVAIQAAASFREGELFVKT
jgi:hypothetical protein